MLTIRQRQVILGYLLLTHTHSLKLRDIILLSHVLDCSIMLLCMSEEMRKLLC